MLYRFLRREKDIAETRAELAQSESLRLRQKCDHLERQYEEAHRNLTGERERTQVSERSQSQSRGADRQTPEVSIETGGKALKQKRNNSLKN